MPEPPDPAEEKEKATAQQRAAAAIERGVAEIKTPAQAARAVETLEETVGALREAEVARANPKKSAEEQAATIEHAVSDAPRAARPAAVIVAAAVESATAAPADKPVVDEAVTEALGGEASTGLAPPDAGRGRRLLRRALFRRLRPLHAFDAFAFVQINQLPHPRAVDLFMSRLSWIMTGGAGWFLLLLLAILCDRQRGWNAARAVAPALWLATLTVEHPIKKWFRRRRPFVSLVRAIIVGRKPGSYSFPSGHSAAAFAGAMLLARQFPGPARAVALYGVASLVAFSRIYLGVHYPGDVLSGSFSGMVLARLYARLLRKIGIAPK